MLKKNYLLDSFIIIKICEMTNNNNIHEIKYKNNKYYKRQADLWFFV